MGGGDLDFLIGVFGILVVLVPVTGLTAILTLRLGGKPFVEALARELREAGAFGAPGSRRSVEELSERVDELTREIRQLREGQSFDRTLLEGSEGEGT